MGGKIDYTIDDNLNIIVDQILNLFRLDINWLPDNLIVKGYLDLSNTNITELPNNLRVGGDLYLNNTKITKLPTNLSVVGIIFISEDMKEELVVPEHLENNISIINRIN